MDRGPTPELRQGTRRHRRGLLVALLAVVVVGLMAVPVLFVFLTGRELTAGIFDVAWAPDSRHLAYTTDAGLWVVPADGSQAPRRLLGQHVESVTWGPDGLRVAFASGQQPDVSLWVVDVATGSARVLADIYPYRPGNYAWAPDADTLAVVGPLGDVDVVEAATGRSRVLMSMAGPSGPVVGPAWSGDASTVVLAGARREGGEGIWAITVEDGEQHLVWPGSVSDVSQLVVEPEVDGRIAFQRCAVTTTDDPDDPRQQECTWYVMQQGGSGLQQLDEVPDWQGADDGLAQPWLYSPDGRHVARKEGAGTGSELWVDSVDGSSRVLVAER